VWKQRRTRCNYRTFQIKRHKVSASNKNEVWGSLEYFDLRPDLNMVAQSHVSDKFRRTQEILCPSSRKQQVGFEFRRVCVTSELMRRVDTLRELLRHISVPLVSSPIKTMPAFNIANIIATIACAAIMASLIAVCLHFHCEVCVILRLRSDYRR
jgi:hypothetical protein